MYALKEAIVTKERFRDDIETTIFYMDMRTFGKDYELYYNRSKTDLRGQFRALSAPLGNPGLDSDQLAIILRGWMAHPRQLPSSSIWWSSQLDFVRRNPPGNWPGFWILN
jgi:hypothetical protein